MIPNEFAPRKVRRKLSNDGPVETGIKAAELFTRKRLGRRVFDPLVERGIVNTLSREQIADQAVSMVELVESGVDDPGRFVAQFGQGYVLTETGLATTGDFEIIEESAATPDHAQQAMMAMTSRELFLGYLPIRALLGGRSQSDSPSLEGAAPLIPRYPTNYYHWMIETVPKVRYLREFENQTDVDVTLLLPAQAPGFVDETLDLLGWPEYRVVRAIVPMYEVRNLIIPSFSQQTPSDFEWLRDEILDAVFDADDVTGDTEGGSEKIYVSRANAISRRVRNEDTVMDVLSKYGFERYLLENRSLAENARLFSQADVVVGPHGAGLTDIVFADDCTLLEFFGSRRNWAYMKLSETLGIEYEPMYCEDDSSDIVVDTDELEAKIKAIVD